MKPRYEIRVNRMSSVHYGADVVNDAKVIHTLPWNPTYGGAVADAKAWLLNHLAEVSVVPTEDSV